MKNEQNGDDTTREESPSDDLEESRCFQQRNLPIHGAHSERNPKDLQERQTHPLLQRQTQKWASSQADREKQTINRQNVEKERSLHGNSPHESSQDFPEDASESFHRVSGPEIVRFFLSNQKEEAQAHCQTQEGSP